MFSLSCQRSQPGSGENPNQIIQIQQLTRPFGLVFFLIGIGDYIVKLVLKWASTWQLLMLNVLPSLASNLLPRREEEADSQSQGGRKGGRPGFQIQVQILQIETDSLVIYDSGQKIWWGVGGSLPCMAASHSHTTHFQETNIQKQPLNYCEFLSPSLSYLLFTKWLHCQIYQS